MGAAASVDEAAQPSKPIVLKALPDALEHCLYVDERWPLVLDPTEQASRFLRYQRGCFLLGAVWKSKFYGAFVLNHRVVLHAIDATPARWRGDAGSSPLDGASTATPSSRRCVDGVEDDAMIQHERAVKF